MALARIITRSHACSRELALDLLARGYTVEIVSPDAIPDNLADLELRVDNAGDQLVANVTAHDGSRSTSLEFLHHLKAPMGDFIRRVPEVEEEPSVAIPVMFQDARLAVENGEGGREAPDVEGNLFEERAESRAPEAVGEREVESVYASAAEIAEPHRYEAENLSTGVFQASVEQESDSPILAPAVVAYPVELVSRSSPENEIPAYFEQKEASPVRAVEAEPLPRIAPRIAVAKFRPGAASWRWRVALTFATVVVLALLLGFGLRRTSKAAAQSSSEAAGDKLAIASSPGALINESVPDKDSANDIVAPAAPDQKAAEDSGRAASRTTVAGAETFSAKSPNAVPKRVSRSHDGDVIARDTVTYLDDRYKPVPKTPSAKNATRRHRTARKHSGEVIAANKVTYLEKPAPKPAK
jgi:hypothetical protein